MKIHTAKEFVKLTKGYYYELASKLYAYDPDTGDIRWKDKNGQRVIGDKSIETRPISLRVENETIPGHHFAWFCIHDGQIPYFQVTHRNNNKRDNRPENLQARVDAAYIKREEKRFEKAERKRKIAEADVAFKEMWDYLKENLTQEEKEELLLKEQRAKDKKIRSMTIKERRAEDEESRKRFKALWNPTRKDYFDRAMDIYGFNIETGQFYWRTPGPGRRINEFGTPGRIGRFQNGNHRLSVDGTYISATHLAIYCITGEVLDHRTRINHVDGNGYNHKPENLKRIVNQRKKP